MLTFYVYVGSRAGKSPCEKAKTFFIFLPAPRNFFCQSSWRPPLPFVPAGPKANAVSRVDNALLFAHGSRFMESSTYLAILRTSFLLLQTPRNVSLLVVVVVVEKVEVLNHFPSEAHQPKRKPTLLPLLYGSCAGIQKETNERYTRPWVVGWVGWLCTVVLLFCYIRIATGGEG